MKKALVWLFACISAAICSAQSSLRKPVESLKQANDDIQYQSYIKPVNDKLKKLTAAYVAMPIKLRLSKKFVRNTGLNFSPY